VTLGRVERGKRKKRKRRSDDADGAKSRRNVVEKWNSILVHRE
jgi:hypothetical protein